MVAMVQHASPVNKSFFIFDLISVQLLAYVKFTDAAQTQTCRLKILVSNLKPVILYFTYNTTDRKKSLHKIKIFYLNFFLS